MAPRRYPEAELTENPTLAEMTSAAIEVLSARDSGFWLMVEAGDVDWANHRNDIDRSIGSVISGDEAVRVITDWVEANSDWDETLLVVTADHGHYLVLVDPEALGG
jgi:alkaline phosphatase